MNRPSLLLLFSLFLFALGCDDGGTRVIVPDPASEMSEEEREAAVQREYEEMEKAQALEMESQAGN